MGSNWKTRNNGRPRWAQENHLLEVSVGAQLDVRDVGHGSRRPLQQAPELRVQGHVMGASQVSDVRVQQDQWRPLGPVGSHGSCCTRTKREFKIGILEGPLEL